MANDEDRTSNVPPPSDSAFPKNLIAAAVLAVIGVIFILQNRNRAEVTFLFFDDRVRVWVVIVVSMVLGALISESLQWARRRSKRKEG